MQVEHRTTIIARCPVNNGVDYYEATFATDTVIVVERIDAAIESLTKEPVYQESLTADLAKALACKVTTVGRHGRFETTVTDGE